MDSYVTIEKYGYDEKYGEEHGGGLMTDWHSMRASDADRDRAADLLKAAMTEGRLSWDEYQVRLDRMMRSKNYGEIHAVISDLPSGISPFPTSAGALAVPSHPAGYVAVPSRGAEPLATASLVCGALGFFTCGATSIPAIITGHVALSKMSPASEPGKGMAIAGLVLGYIPLGLWIFFGFILFGILR